MEMREANCRRATAALLIFSILIACTSIIFGKYEYGSSDQWGFLASLQRYFDPGFAPNDLYVDAYDGVSIRYYLILLMAPFVRWFSYPYTFFIGQMLTAAVIAFSSGLAAKRLFSKVGGVEFVAASFSLLLIGNRFGMSTLVYEPSLLAREIAVAIVLFGVAAFALSMRPRLFALTAFLSAMIHPQVGAETGGIVLAGFAVLALKKKDGIWSAVQGLLILVSLLAVTWILPMRGFSNPQLTTDTYVHIVAQLRNPHHMILGNPFLNPTLVLFLTAVFSLIFVLRRLWMQEWERMTVVLTALICVPVALFVGYFFTEVKPSRLGPSLQAARLIFFVNWLLYILLAALATQALHLLVSLVRARKAAWSTESRSLWGQWIHQNWLTLLLAGFCVAVFLKQVGTSFYLPLGSFLVGAALVSVFFRRFRILQACFGLAVCFLLFYPVVLGSDTQLGPVINWQAKAQRVNIDKEARVFSEFAKRNTPPEASFLVPPNWTPFRACAGRTIVADFKSFPYRDDKMLEWFSRIKDIYSFDGYSAGGFDVVGVARRGYRQITPEKLKELATKYGFSHAILYKSSLAGMTPIFTGKTYAMVEIPQEWRAQSSQAPAILAASAPNPSRMPAAFTCVTPNQGTVSE